MVCLCSVCVGGGVSLCAKHTPTLHAHLRASKEGVQNLVVWTHVRFEMHACTCFCFIGEGGEGEGVCVLCARC